MIISDGWINRIGQWLGGTVVIVFQGTQPTMGEYLANGVASTNLLQVVLTGTEGGGGSTPLITEPNTLGYTQALYSFRSGTGTWAIIADGYEPDVGIMKAVDSYDNIDGYYFMTEEQAWYIIGLATQTNFSIVPISDLTGTGVVKFNSIEFSHPDTADEDRVVDMSITVARAEG